MALGVRAGDSERTSTATLWSRWRHTEAGATGAEYVVLVGVIGLAVIGGVAALQAGTTRAVDGQSTNIATSPQFAQMPDGSGGPGDSPLTPIPGPDPDPEPEPTATFNAGLTETRRVGGNDWQATVYLDVTDATTVTLSVSPPGSVTGGTLTCTVVAGRCELVAGDWLRQGGGQNTPVTSVQFTVTQIDGAAVDDTISLNVDRP